MSRPAKITIMSEQFRGQIFQLTEGEYLIGRLEDCDIHLPDPMVSSRHAKLVKHTNGEYILQDLGSTNGTHVAGKAINDSPVVLTNSDVFKIGGAKGVEVMYTSAGEVLQNPDVTKTVFDISDFDSQKITPDNVGPLDHDKKKRGTIAGFEYKKATAAIFIFLGILITCVIGAIVYFVVNLMK